MITICMRFNEDEDFDYSATSPKGHKTSVRSGFKGLLIVLAEAYHYDIVTQADEAIFEEWRQATLRDFTRHVIDDLLQLRAAEMPKGYGLLIDLLTDGGVSYDYMDRHNDRSNHAFPAPKPAVNEAKENAREFGL